MRTEIVILVVAALSFAACNKNEELKENVNYPADGVIRVATSVENLKTRAGATADNLAKLGLCVTNPNTTTPSYSYANKELTKKDGIWSSTDLMLWQNSTQSVEIVAYAPYQSTEPYTTETTDAAMNVLADQSNESGIIASDFLGQRKTGYIPKDSLVSGKINLALGHLMSKVNISITLGTEFNTTPGTDTNPITGITVKGTQLKGLCNFTNMNVTRASTNNDATNVTPFTGEYKAGVATTTQAVANYEVILVPQEVTANGFSVGFVINNKYYAWTSTDAVTLASGTQYALKLTVGKDLVTIGSLTASDWTTGGSGNVETE